MGLPAVPFQRKDISHLLKTASPGILLSLTSGSEIESPTAGLR